MSMDLSSSNFIDDSPTKDSDKFQNDSSMFSLSRNISINSIDISRSEHPNTANEIYDKGDQLKE